MALPVREVLVLFNVPLESWGMGQAKSVDDLANEIKAGETRLYIDNQGLFRAVRIVKMIISHPLLTHRGHVIELSQELPDGQVRTPNEVPSGKILGKETPDQALARELAEELHVSEHLFTVKDVTVGDEERPSKSYPGLKCWYEVHRFAVEVAGMSEIHNAQEFLRVESDGTKHVFRWQEW